MDLEGHLRNALAGAYRIDRELGGGGMSRVFSAEELALGRQVAIKVLSDGSSGVSIERFRREIETVAKLQHPHIVPLLNAGTADSTVFYTMPLVEGESLRARLERDGSLGVREAVRYARDVAGALVYAHEHGVLHRDIKPDNVLITGGHAVVTDFGIAKALSMAAETGSLTETGLALGTPLYMAPEQLLAEPNVDHRADLYALGCLLFEMLAGRPPFEARTAQALLSAHVTRAPDDLQRVRNDVPHDVADWVRHALAKDPDERWSAPEQALAELEACLAHLSVGREGTAAGRLPRWMWPAVAAAVVVAGAGVALLSRSGGAVPIESDRIAVMPFQPTNPADTALTRLGRDLVVTLTANLDGVGDLRMIDPLSVLAQTSASDVRDPARALAVASGLGAGSALVGTLVSAGARARLDYRLLRTTGSGPAIASGSVTAPLGDEGILTLTDSATWGMLRAIVPARSGALPSFELMHTRSVPALRAFIEGENHLLANRWAEAEQAYARAIEADSTFWFAYRRVVQAADWIFSAFRRAHEDSIAWEHRASFPERERLLMEHSEAGGFGAQLAALEEITQRFPDYWYGWFQYGDDILHNGVRLSLTPLDANQPLDEALSLNPRLVPVLDHQILFMNDSAVAEQAYARLRALYGSAWDTLLTDYGIGAESFYGAVVVRRRTEGGSAALERYGTDLGTRRLLLSLLDFGVAVPIFGLDPRGQLEAARIARTHGPPDTVLTSLARWDALAWAMRGAWDSAAVALDRSWADRPSAGLARVRAGLGAMAYFTGAADEGFALDERRFFADYPFAEAGVPTRDRLLAFLDGMIAYTGGRPGELREAADRLRASSEDEAAAHLARALDAFRLDLDGRREAAADSLVALEQERGRGGVFDYDAVPFIRLSAGRWTGRPGEADALLSYYEAGLPDVVGQFLLKATAGLAALERARVQDRAGDRGEAMRRYREFLRIYDLAPLVHGEMVEEATTALTRLGS